jgi:hypothetical protein
MRAEKQSGTGFGVLAAGDNAFTVSNDLANILILRGSGDVLVAGNLFHAAGGSTTTARVPTAIGTVAQTSLTIGTTETSFGTITVPAGTMRTNGDVVRVTMHWLTSGTATTTRCKFGASYVLSWGASTDATRYQTTGISRIAATSQVAGGFDLASSVGLETIITSETLSAAVVVDFRASAAAAGTVVTLEYATVEYIPAP